MQITSNFNVQHQYFKGKKTYQGKETFNNIAEETKDKFYITEKKKMDKLSATCELWRSKVTLPLVAAMLLSVSLPDKVSNKPEEEMNKTEALKNKVIDTLDIDDDGDISQEKMLIYNSANSIMLVIYMLTECIEKVKSSVVKESLYKIQNRLFEVSKRDDLNDAETFACMQNILAEAKEQAESAKDEFVANKIDNLIEYLKKQEEELNKAIINNQEVEMETEEEYNENN